MTGTIVFADNERNVRRFCKQELEAAGFRVLLAEDGVEAVDLVETFAVDVVILDEHMPRCNGLEAARRIKISRPDIPVIMFTADSDYERFKSPLVDSSVMKSENLEALATEVIRCCPCSSISPIASDGAQLYEVARA